MGRRTKKKVSGSFSSYYFSFTVSTFEDLVLEFNLILRKEKNEFCFLGPEGATGLVRGRKERAYSPYRRFET